MKPGDNDIKPVVTFSAVNKYLYHIIVLSNKRHMILVITFKWPIVKSATY